MSRLKVLVKRLVCIEDLGDVDVLFTDKTGTLTQGRIDFARAVPADGDARADVLAWGLLCTEDFAGGGVGGNPLDQALWRSPDAAAAGDLQSAWSSGFPPTADPSGVAFSVHSSPHRSTRSGPPPSAGTARA